LTRVAFLIAGVALTATFGTIACDRSMTARDSTAAPSSLIGPTPTFTSQITTLSGIVWLRGTGVVQPYTGVKVWGWAETGRSGSRIGPVTTDADGRYTFQVSPGTFVRVQVSANYQPCVAGVGVTGNMTRDVYIINNPNLLGNQLPTELLADTPTLSGMVFEITEQGRQPVAQVRVELDMIYGMGDVSATTLTDSQGRYVLCGLSGHDSTYLYASKAGYRLADVGTVVLNGNTVRDIELKR
jgi:hypothetical protein